MVRPPRLVSGQRVALVAPASAPETPADFRHAETACRALGLTPVLGPNARKRIGYLAGSDEERLADLNAALADPTTDAVWCLRGGYGITRVLDRVDLAPLARRPKVIIGYSDITALLLAVTHLTGIVTFHGPVALARLTTFTRRHLERVLLRAAPAGVLDALPPARRSAARAALPVSLSGGVASGPLLGGNLTLLHGLLGTPYFPDPRGAILFLEDVGEPLYAVDRMLSHLRLAGALDRIAGVAVGQFGAMKRRERDRPMTLEDVLRHYFEPLGVPVVLGFPIGHIESQWTIPIGVRARLDADACSLELLEPAVA